MGEFVIDPIGRASISRAAGGIRVRPAVPDDWPRIAAIYNEGIRSRGATFETAERDADDVRPWTEPLAVRVHPCLVANDDSGTVVGWARASEYRTRACYATVAEFSVYVAEGARGRRVGDMLLSAFVPACVEVGLTKLVSRIFPENAASRALCARHGFREVGRYEKHARLDGVWRDVVIVERLLIT